MKAAILPFAVALVLAVSGCATATSSGKGLPVSSDPTLDAGRTLIGSRCSRCHTLDRIRTATHDKTAWGATVSRMRSNGAQLTDAEAESIVNYLASR